MCIRKTGKALLPHSFTCSVKRRCVSRISTKAQDFRELALEAFAVLCERRRKKVGCVGFVHRSNIFMAGQVEVTIYMFSLVRFASQRVQPMTVEARRL